jgi:uncharacterized protein (DUF885 family)
VKRPLVLLVLCSCATAQPKNGSQQFADFLAEAYASSLRAHPMQATNAGEKGGNDRWDDESPAALAAETARIGREKAAAVAQFETANLDPKARLQYRVFLGQEQLLLDRAKWRDHLYALNQIVGLHLDVPALLVNKQPLDSAADAGIYLKRLEAAARPFDQLVAHLESQAKQGIYMPKSVYPLLIAGARTVIREPVETQAIYVDFQRRVQLLKISPDERARLENRCKAALTVKLKPAYEELIAALTRQETVTPVDGGVWQLPQGDELYAFLVRQFTTTGLAPAQIHELGLQEVKRVHEEMAAILKRVGFTGTVKEFIIEIKADPKSYFTNDDEGREQYLTKARATVAAVQARVPQWFPGPVPLPLEVRRAPAYREATAPSGSYGQGPADGKTPGTVNLNLSDMRSMSRFDMDALLYHEGVPGHHLQISTIQVDASIPKLRKVEAYWQNSAFVEGWALYAEGLAKEMGFYQDPYADFGRLAGELWRATRLVVDSGLHYKRWTRAQAIQYLNENTPSPEAANAGAVDRYLAVPGQATSFTVGMKKFSSERERAKQALGAKFDIREYHRVVLENGFVPLWAVEAAVNEWMASKKQ